MVITFVVRIVMGVFMPVLLVTPAKINTTMNTTILHLITTDQSLSLT